MQKVLLLSVFILLCFSGISNNIKITGEAKVVAFTGVAKDTAIVEFDLSWENSWRDDFNWDAAWIFLKYKKRGETEQWHPAYLTQTGHEVVSLSGNEGGGYTFMFGEVGATPAAKVTGVYLMRDGISEGNVKAKLRLKWPIQSNSELSLNTSDFGADMDSIYVAAYAVEMVYVPYGAYYLGDDFSNGTFVKGVRSVIPEEKDVVDNQSGYEITASGYYSAAHLPIYASDHVNNSIYPASNWYHHTSSVWWKIDFKVEKTIKYFGVTGSTNYPSDYFPTATWYLRGSNDNVEWTELSALSPSQWCLDLIAYPIQHSIKVDHPGSYRYYKIDIPVCVPGILVQSIAMTEAELFPDGLRFYVEGEEGIALGSNLIARDGQVWAGTLPVSYPKGYRGYYMMKYEVSQQQYVEFLNSLTFNQQKNRVSNNNFTTMKKGDYVFGDLKQPNNRNGIAFLTLKGANTPAIFGNNLNPGNDFYSEDDGQTLACNYLSPADMLAYCDWSGLRPMSELEYEKACRRPYPQKSEKGEYAWNANTGVNRITKLADLTGENTERETPFDYRVNVNAGGKLNGPVRSGAFATSRTGQTEAGTAYWGGMEMSGNLWEMCYNANIAGAKFVGDHVDFSHGDGYIADAGTDIAAAYWPNVPAAIAVRGGSFAAADSLLRTSDRTFASGNYFTAFTKRDSTVGFRGVRSILNTSGFAAGRICCQNRLVKDTACLGESYTILGDPAENTIGKTTYTWYVSEDAGTSWSLVENAVGVSLAYDAINPTDFEKQFMFKRKVICAVGEESSVAVTMCIMPKPILDLQNRYYAANGYAYYLPLPGLNAGEYYNWRGADGVLHEKVSKTPIQVTADYQPEGFDGLYKIQKNVASCFSDEYEIQVTGTDAIVVERTVNKAWYVNAEGGDDSYSGTEDQPFKTVQKAVDACAASGDVIYIAAGTYDVTTPGGSYGIGGLWDKGKSIIFVGVSGQTVFFCDGSAGRYHHTISTRGVNTEIFGIIFNVKYGYQEASYQRAIFGHDVGYTNAKVYNCVFIFNKAPSFHYDNSAQNSGYIYNSLFVTPGNFLGSYSGHDINVVNCAVTTYFSDGVFKTCLQNVAIDNAYNITSPDWFQAGTGTNFDGTKSNIGVYGGYSWPLRIIIQ